MNLICKSAAAVAALLLAPTAGAALETFEASGANPASINLIDARDAFRAAVGGGTIAGANGSFGGLRREINWDGVPDIRADPNLLPANFFNVNSPRGAVFSTPGTGFLVSANAGLSTTTLFGFPNDFQTFTSRPSARSDCSQRSTATSPRSPFSSPERPPPRRPALSLPSSSMSKSRV